MTSGSNLLVLCLFLGNHQYLLQVIAQLNRWQIVLQLLPRFLPTPDDLALFLNISNALHAGCNGAAANGNADDGLATVDLPALRIHQSALRLLLHVWLQLDSCLSAAAAASARIFDAAASLSAALQRVHTRDTSVTLIAENSPLACRCVQLMASRTSAVLVCDEEFESCSRKFLLCQIACAFGTCYKELLSELQCELHYSK
jgi:hypothetical protein